MIGYHHASGRGRRPCRGSRPGSGGSPSRRQRRYRRSPPGCAGTGTPSQQFRQIGNAVPPSLAITLPRGRAALEPLARRAAHCRRMTRQSGNAATACRTQCPRRAAVSAVDARQSTSRHAPERRIRSTPPREGSSFSQGLRDSRWRRSRSSRHRVHQEPRRRLRRWLLLALLPGPRQHPRRNTAYWDEKLARNVARDQRVSESLWPHAGWR